MLLNHLLTSYRKIKEQELQTKFDETIHISYRITDPINNIFNAVKDLVELAELTGYPYTKIQQANIGYLIVTKQRIFRDGVRK